MPKFASAKAAATVPKPGQAKTVNAAGGVAFTQTPRTELASLVLTSMLKDRFHQKAAEDQARVVGLVSQLNATGDLKFAAKAALYARNTHGLRSISHVVAAEIGRRAFAQPGDAPWVRKFFKAIIRRPDDASEIVAYWLANTAVRKDGKKQSLPNAMKRGIGDALRGFDAYRLAKYKGDGKSVGLVDVVNLCHPKPTEALTALMKGTLAAPDTWEKSMTDAGKKAEAAKETGEGEANVDVLKGAEWDRLIESKKLGYLALLRNLRNIMQQATVATLEAALAQLTDPAFVKRSLVFPFQFLTAGEAISELGHAEGRRVMLALSQAVDLSLQNVPEFAGKTLIALDVSGSMTSTGSSVKEMGACIRIASVFAAVLLRRNPTAQLIMFDDKAKYVTPPEAPTMATAGWLTKAATGGGTNFGTIFATAKGKYDRIVILSDMQGWMGGASDAWLAPYKKREGCDPFIYSFDLAGHGTSQFPEAKVCAVSGWSDKVFDLMASVEQDPAVLINTIDAVAI